MKPQHYIVGLILLVFSLSQTVTAQTIEEHLTGRWTFNYNASLDKMHSGARAHHSKMRESSKKTFEDAFKGRVMIFNDDGSYRQELSGGRIGHGVWTITQGLLELTMSNGRKTSFTIAHIEASVLTLKPLEIKGKPLMTYWQLSKN